VAVSLALALGVAICTNRNRQDAVLRFFETQNVKGN
jgi:hypothetical protein